MDEQKLRIFNAIASFVNDLNTGFGKKYKPVALYNRLIEKTTLRDVESIDRHIKVFRSFFDSYPNYIKDKHITSGMRIEYSERVFLDFTRIFSKTEASAHKHIHQHLMTIYTLINIGTKKGKEALMSLKEESEKNDPPSDLNLPDTTEGNFIKNTLDEMTSHLENLDTDNPNPMAMISNMMNSGFVGKFMGELQSKFSNGEMNIGSLMGTVTSVISAATPPGSDEANQLKDFMSNSVKQMTQNEAVPPELKKHMDTMFKNIGGDKNPDDTANDTATEDVD